MQIQGLPNGVQIVIPDLRMPMIRELTDLALLLKHLGAPKKMGAGF